MKRVWFGVVLLVLLLALSLWTERALARQILPVGRELAEAAALARGEDWQGAEQAMLRAEGYWRRGWRCTACLADHAPMEEIDAVFKELRVYADRREEADFSAACARLIRLTRAVWQAHVGTWWNLI